MAAAKPKSKSSKASPKVNVLLRDIEQGWKPPKPLAVTEAAYARMEKGMKVAYPKSKAETDRLLAAGWKLANSYTPKKKGKKPTK